jgi:sulfatase maturation enzyme AslB (radical SAM superfamily)
MGIDDKVNQIEKNKRFTELYERDYKARMQFARENGCNTVILTGKGEALQNQNFLTRFAHYNEMIDNPFRWIELQTTGVYLTDETLRFLRNTIRVSTIALSIANVFDSEDNARTAVMSDALKFDIDELCAEIKRYDFNLRICINMTSRYLGVAPETIFDRLFKLNADQVLFRLLYESQGDAPEDKWVRDNRLTETEFAPILAHIQKHGRELEKLPTGASRYSVGGVSTVVDDDCMSRIPKDVVRYLILQPNCKLYSKWDDPGSLIF